MHESAVSRAVRRSGIDPPATTHALRHSFAAHPLTGGADLRTVRERLGHESVEMTTIDTHVLNRAVAV